MDCNENKKTLDDYTKEVYNAFIDTDISNTKKYYAVMCFESELELNISTIPNKWVNTKNVFFTNGTKALNFYANYPNPASQIVDGDSITDLANEMTIMFNNMNDEVWLNNSLYPYL